MKINYVLGYYYSPFDHDDLKLASNWQEIEQTSKATFTENQYTFYQLLSLNKEFWEEIIKSRKNLDIDSDGWNWERLEDWFTSSLDLSIPGVQEYQRNIRFEENRIKSLFKLHRWTELQVDKLILGNFVFPIPEEKIEIVSEDKHQNNMDDPDTKMYAEYYPARSNDSNDKDGVLIKITEKVNKRRLRTFIENNWELLEQKMEALPKEDNFGIAEKDKKIVKLRDEDSMTFSEITDHIFEDNPDWNNEDAIRKAYYRVKKRISITAKKL